MTTEDRLQLSGWWPTKGNAAREEFVGPEACEACHSTKAGTQKRTPMAHASTHGADAEALRAHDEMTFRHGPYFYRVKRTETGSAYSVSDGTKDISIPIDWVFGLGESGQTFVLSYQGTWYESRVSYFRELDGLDLTPTPSPTPSSTLEAAIGRPMLSGGETQRCFSCHTTASTTRNKFDPAHLIPGVTCEACHGPGAKHIAAMRAQRNKEGLRSILNPGLLDPVDLVDFCGACHRTYMDVLLTGTFGIPNLRFQPYRLKLSQCWLKTAGITCLSCHNPHQPRSRDAAFYDDRCLACHSTGASVRRIGKPCPRETRDCVSCHMPKYEMPGMHFKFTDHFIRIVRKGEPYID
jgi:Cytochrome c554 and c-prime